MDDMFSKAAACQRAFNSSAYHLRYMVVNKDSPQPVEMSAFEKAIKAISYGDQFTFYNSFDKAPEKCGELLVAAVNRGGQMGQQFVKSLLDITRLDKEEYQKVYFSAIKSGQIETACLLQEHAQTLTGDNCSLLCWRGMFLALTTFRFYDLKRDRSISQLLFRCSDEQIRGVKPEIQIALIKRLIEAGADGPAANLINMRSLSQPVFTNSDELEQIIDISGNNRLMSLLHSVCESVRDEMEAEYER